MRRLFPEPLLSGGVFLFWLLLSQSVAPLALLTGALLAVTVPLATAPLRPTPARIRRPIVAARLAARVIYDSLLSNLAVIRAIVFKRADSLSSAFVRIPLDVRDPNALAVLSMIVTATPGTAWAQVAHDRSALLLHVLEVDDEAELVAHIKSHYERPLMEIFE